MDFFSRLETRIENAGTILCVGLDPHQLDLAEDSPKGILDFCEFLIAETRGFTAAYKPNSAFFEAYGPEGMQMLQEVVNLVPSEIPVILDAKRGDISSTAEAYARAAFDVYKVDAITINPYLGFDSIEPFIRNPEKGIFLLCKTSNPGADDLQNLVISGGDFVYQHVAAMASGWNTRGNIGLVIGATQVEAIDAIRKENDDVWMLAPGIGVQGGEVEEAISAGLNSRSSGLLLPVSRTISRADDPGAAARRLRDRFLKAVNAHSHFVMEKLTVVNQQTDFERKEVARGLLKAGCVQFGEFTLKSGEKSPFYIDLRRLVGYPQLMHKIARLFAEMLETQEYDLLAPLPYAALPIGSAVSLLVGCPMIYPRKEVKEYGTKAAVEGVYEPGQIALVLDDLITTGGSKLEAINKLENVGLVVKDISVLIDRQKENESTLEEHGFQLHSIFKFEELLGFYEQEGLIEQLLIDSSRLYLESD